MTPLLGRALSVRFQSGLRERPNFGLVVLVFGCPLPGAVMLRSW